MIIEIVMEHEIDSSNVTLKLKDDKLPQGSDYSPHQGFVLKTDKTSISPSNAVPKNYYSHLSKVISKKGQLPSYFIFYPTSRCNMKCTHCFYHDSLNKKFNELSIEEIDNFTKTMNPLLHLIITGGEPYVRPDIDVIVRTFYENTKVPIITIPSNGFFKERMVSQIQNIMKWCPQLILNQNISIDGLYEQHEEIRGIKGCFDQALETIKELKKLQEKYNRINIGTIATFTSQNQHNFKEIIKGIYELAAPDNIAINLVRGNPKEKVNLNLDMNMYREAVKFRDDLFFENKMTGHSRFKGNKLATAARIILNEKTQEIHETNSYVMPCFAGNLSGVMYPEGDVYPCEILDASHKIGNIREYNYDFKRLWLSQKAKNEVGFIRDTKCFCTHECFNTVNILFNAKYYPRILKIAAQLS